MAEQLEAGLKFESETQSEIMAGDACIKFLKRSEGGFKVLN